MKVRTTAAEFASKMGISYVISSGLLSYLEDIGSAQVVEKQRHSSGRGKPTRVYELDENLTINLSKLQ
jgi:predicted ArsR family transcriptional regulator